MIELGLQRISKLLAKTPFPWRAIHVAGTNGKGSICTYVIAMLSAYNRSSYREASGQPALRPARFTSPHLIDRWDCIQIGSKTVSRKVFEAAEQRALQRNADESIGASEFEIMTATAFELLTRMRTDVAVVEVGMGGRLDATNVIGQSAGVELPPDGDIALFRPPPLVTGIAKIGLDHQSFLGNTLEEIAAEKAGIFKEGVPLVYDTSNAPEVIDVLRARATGRIVEHRDSIMPEQEWKMDTPEAASRHKLANLDVAYRATWTALQSLGRVPGDYSTLPISDQESLSQLARSMSSSAYNASMPGRLQYIGMQRLSGRVRPVLLDGAHNLQSAQVLYSEVCTLRKKEDSPVAWVFAFSNTKDIAEMLEVLVQPGDTVFAVEFGPVDGMPWVKAKASAEIVQAVRHGGKATEARDCGNDLTGALQAAAQQSSGGPMVVAGSLYLVSDVLRLLKNTTSRPSTLTRGMVRNTQKQPLSDYHKGFKRLTLAA